MSCCHIDRFDRLSFVELPSVVKQGAVFCSQTSKKLIKPLQNKTLLLYLYCKTNHIQL